MGTSHQVTTTSTRHEPATGQPVVVLVGHDASALKEIESTVRVGWPAARVESLPSTTDLVFRLAGDGVSVVLIDAEHIDELPPSLFNLSLSISPRLRIGLLGGPDGSARRIAPAELPAWLQAAQGPLT